MPPPTTPTDPVISTRVRRSPECARPHSLHGLSSMPSSGRVPTGQEAGAPRPAGTTMVSSARRADGARSAHDQRQDHPDRASRLPHLRLQGPADLQPVVREERHRRRRRADGRQARGVPGVLPAAVQDEQHPRRAGDHAAQGDDHRAGRRAHADRPGRRRGQRGAGAGGRLAARRPVRRRRLRARRPAQGLRAAGQAGAGRRQRRRRLADRRLAGRGRAWARIGLFDPNAAASEALAERLREHYPDARGDAPAPRTRRATTWSSTPPRWA